MNSTMYYDAKTVFGTLAQGVNDGRELTPGLGIDENTAMVINPGRELEVLGYQGALLLDLSQATSDGGKDFYISNVRVSYLDRGDRYNLRTRRFAEPVYSADILGYASASSEGYSILNLRLDVRPLQITRPWYQ